MAKDATEIKAGLGEKLWVADIGSTIPTDHNDVPNSSWYDLGYVSEDGVEFESEQEYRDQRAWQARRLIGQKKVAVNETVTFGLMQFNFQTVSLAFGGTTTTDMTGYYRVEPPADSDPVDYRMMLVDWKDGDYVYRLVYRKVLVAAAARLTLKADDDIVLPMTLTVFEPASGRPWTLLTDDPDFDPTP